MWGVHLRHYHGYTKKTKAANPISCSETGNDGWQSEIVRFTTCKQPTPLPKNKEQKQNKKEGRQDEEEEHEEQKQRV